MSPDASDDWAFRSAAELAAGIRVGEVSSREALAAFVDRVTRLDGTTNSVVTLDVERATLVATAADEAAAHGEELGPLHGVPITIKDSFQTAGLHTTSGAPELADFVPDVDAWPVTRLKAAGAVVWAKTNLPIYAGDFQTYNEVFGTTTNPYDAARTPGGSSGGSAVALACGFTPLELGSDIAGSIRLPAHMTGVAGHKPSYGVVAAHGQIPGPPGTLSQADLAVVGPMARTVADLELALEVLAGPDRWNAPAWRLELPPPRAADLAGYRIAAWFDDERCPVEPEVRVMLEQAAAALAVHGAKVDAEARPGFTLTKAVDTFFTLLHAALSGGHSRAEIESWGDATSHTPLDDTRRRSAIRHREWLAANESRLQMRLRWEQFFTKYDVMLLPVMACTAFPHDHDEPQAGRTIWFSGRGWPYWDAVSWMAPAGACYLPATVVSVGRTPAGLPVGIQVVGPYLHDRTTLRLARHLETILGVSPRPAGF